MIVGVYIETAPSGAFGHAEALPGCFAMGQSADEVLALLPAVIAEFVSWLRRHGEESPLALPEGELPTVEVLQTITAEEVPATPGNRAALFAEDRGYLSDAELTRRLRWLEHSRADLLALVQPGDPATLNLSDPHDGAEGEPWTVRRILWHSANAEYGYGLRVAGPWLDMAGLVDDDHPSELFARMATIRAIFSGRLGAMPLAERDRVFYRVRAGRADEPWTLKKSLRRALEHEREHMQQISALLYRVEQERGPKVGG